MSMVHALNRQENMFPPVEISLSFKMFPLWMYEIDYLLKNHIDLEKVLLSTKNDTSFEI